LLFTILLNRFRLILALVPAVVAKMTFSHFFCDIFIDIVLLSAANIYQQILI